MSAHAKDLKGMKFGRLTVIERAEGPNKNHAYWLCQCECEKETKTIVRGSRLISGETVSCGCMTLEKVTKHGQHGTRIYRIYRGMLTRCGNPNDAAYYKYGARGIRICDEWLGKQGFQLFYQWSMENGYSDDLTIDRIDNNGNYSPSNCRWTTNKEQCNNRRSSTYITIGQETKTVAEWADESGISHSTLHNRIKSGVTGYDLLKPPSQAKYQSGVLGIQWCNGKWRVVIDRKFIGAFKDLNEAIGIRQKYISDHSV